MVITETPLKKLNLFTGCNKRESTKNKAPSESTRTFPMSASTSIRSTGESTPNETLRRSETFCGENEVLLEAVSEVVVVVGLLGFVESRIRVPD